MQHLLEAVEFRNPTRAREDIARLGDGIPERIRARIQSLLAAVPDPDEALHFLERLREDCPAAFNRISSSLAALRCLITTFSYSRFLSEAVLQHPEWLLQAASRGDLHRMLSAEEFAERLVEFHAAGGPDQAAPVTLARFRRRQSLRILLRDVLELAALADITGELSNLADAILDFAYRQIRAQLTARHGQPWCEGPDGQRRVCEFAVIALGKLGGQELNYSSDVDLMFVYSGNGETAGPETITNKEFFKKVANQYTESLSTYTADGSCYRVDLRLRPDGRLGEVCISLEGAKRYYQERARDWEKQMLIKARVCAGDLALGRELLEFVEPLIYASTLDFRAVEAVSEARERISEKLAAKRAHGGLDIKLTPGGIRDIEFLVQCLQRLHGGRELWVRHGGTLFALSRAHDKNLLSAGEYARLASAYEFLRHIEHRLQFYDDRQTHTLPTHTEELEVLARKMPAESGEALTAESLQVRLETHLGNVREMYTRVIQARKPMYYTLADGDADDRWQPLDLDPLPSEASNLTRSLDERAPQLAAALARARLNRGRERFELFLEKALAGAESFARLNADAALVERAVDIFEHSQYFGDQLLRHPEMLADLDSGAAPREEAIADGASLRSYFRRQMFRIQSDSLLRPAPIFETLERTSDLADTVIAAAYRIALEEAPQPADPDYRPARQMMVVSLGRLGMREFDLASDADLIFVIPDEDAGEQVFWTAVAERMINAISAYTGDGVMFTVDTRLRPNGREGALVQPEGTYREYFAKHAEAWEGIAYMKARAVAGNLERATEFLHRLQEVDWRRYGQSGRSRKELAQMRARLEKEQGARNPLKAAAGGYYDIDFALMYLRLRGAGIFYKVLNTPARIDVIEQMGHLEREDADFLRDAAVFYRAIDHGLRVASGYAGGHLPTSPSQSETLAELVRRWTPDELHDQRLDLKLGEIRQKTREFFNRIFGP
jgi:[glutamine synthetase] adenylyltransferase / [glutamine synthetase]-adenylyl-L-tyrosine phosphorylase